MEDIYPTVTIKIIGGNAPFQYEVSLKDATNIDAPTAQSDIIRTGTYNTIEEVIACFEWGLKTRLQELIRERLKNALVVEFSLQDAYPVPK
jgi:hypothetical protein